MAKQQNFVVVVDSHPRIFSPLTLEWEKHPRVREERDKHQERYVDWLPPARGPKGVGGGTSNPGTCPLTGNRTRDPSVHRLRL